MRLWATWPRHAILAGAALVVAAAGWLVGSAALWPFPPSSEGAASESDTPAASWDADELAYEATAGVFTRASERYKAEAGAKAFERKLRARVRQALPELADEPWYRVTVRPVPGAPLVLVSAQAPSPESATRLAHEAAYLLVETVRGLWARGDEDRVVQAMCSPPALVRRPTRSRSLDRVGVKP